MSSAFFEQGVEYRGRVEISAPAYLYSEADVRQELEGVGWSSVRVWENSDGLPQDWPPEAKSDPTGFGHSMVYIDGIWTKPSGEQPSSGSKWKLLDYWVYARPSAAQPTPGQPEVQPVQVQPYQPIVANKSGGGLGLFGWAVVLGAIGGGAWWMHKRHWRI